jgi:hypothetical protein
MFAHSLRWIKHSQLTGSTVTIYGVRPPPEGEPDVLINMRLPGMGEIVVPWRTWLTAAVLHGVIYEEEEPKIEA